MPEFAKRRSDEINLAIAVTQERNKIIIARSFVKRKIHYFFYITIFL